MHVSFCLYVEPFISQVVCVAVVFLIGTGLKLCLFKKNTEENSETGDDNNPPTYEDVLDQVENTCPSYNQALEMTV